MNQIQSLKDERALCLTRIDRKAIARMGEIDHELMVLHNTNCSICAQGTEWNQPIMRAMVHYPGNGSGVMRLCKECHAELKRMSCKIIKLNGGI